MAISQNVITSNKRSVLLWGSMHIVNIGILGQSWLKP